MSDKSRTPLTDEILAELQRHMDRTLVGPHVLLKQTRDAIPAGLTRPTIENWLYRRCKSANKDYLAFVLEQWRSLPDGDRQASLKKDREGGARPEYTLITPELRALLNSYADRQFLPGVVLKLYPDYPTGLKPNHITTWIHGPAKQARTEHLEFVLEKCKQMAKLSD